MTSTVEGTLCAIDGCEVLAKVSGLCGTHYMVKWRGFLRQFETELWRVQRQYGPASGYFCDGDQDCKAVPDRWWVKDGVEPLALCYAHAEQIVDSYRHNIRRLELKQT